MDVNGVYIKKRRKELGLSQGQLAAVAKTSQGNIQRWEAGKVAYSPNVRRVLDVLAKDKDDPLIVSAKRELSLNERIRQLEERVAELERNRNTVTGG